MTHHKLAHDKLAHGAWVFVGDGRKALFPINKRDETFPNPHPDAEEVLERLKEERGNVEILHGETSGAAREI